MMKERKNEIRELEGKEEEGEEEEEDYMNLSSVRCVNLPIQCVSKLLRLIFER